ncbi:RNA polymerase II mediator complex subunit [Savitreella phatthalungensis]
MELDLVAPVDSRGTNSAAKDEALQLSNVALGLIDDVQTERTHAQVLTPRMIRAKALVLVDLALNEAALATDFVSLLLSRTKTNASQGISPALRQVVPPGTLVYDQYSPVEQAIMVSEAHGLLLRAASASFRRLYVASVRTRRFSFREQRFWREVKGVADRGWPTRHGSAAVSVRYGTTGAHTIHLRSAESGLIDSSSLESRSVDIAVIIVYNGEVVECASTFVGKQGEALDDRLATARKSIFARSLFRRVLSEAQTACVGWSAESIEWPVDAEMRVRIELGSGDAIQRGSRAQVLLRQLIRGAPLCQLVDLLGHGKERRLMSNKLADSCGKVVAVETIGTRTTWRVQYFGQTILIRLANLNYMVRFDDNSECTSRQEALRIILARLEQILYAHLQTQLGLERAGHDIFSGHTYRQTWNSVLVDNKPVDTLS